MLLNSSHILLDGIRLYGHHGVSFQEHTIGSWYNISLDLNVDISTHALIDNNLHSTVDYGTVVNTVRNEFSHSSLLLENVAYRICKAVFRCSPRIDGITIRVSKINPPVSAPTQSASVELSFRK